MTRAQYLDPSSEQTIAVELHDDFEPAVLVEKMLGLSSGRGHPAFELIRSDDSSLSIGTDGNRAVLVWIDSLDVSRHSVSDHSGPVLVYDYFGSWSEALAQWTVPLADALDSARRFLTTGIPESEAVLFELD